MQRPWEVTISEWDLDYTMTEDELMESGIFDKLNNDYLTWMQLVRTTSNPLRLKSFESKKKIWENRKLTIVDPEIIKKREEEDNG